LRADAPEPGAESERARARAELQELIATVDLREGPVVIGDGLATVRTDGGLRFIDSDDSTTVLSRIWGNPPSTVLGMLVPSDFHPTNEASWAVVLDYTKDGHVDDKDAGKINYDKLLKQMQRDTESRNKEREKEGYEKVELLGWAEPPHYDAAQHHIYWAKRLRFGGADGATLNYCIRLLGREGVLELNAVGSEAQLAEIQQKAPALLSSVTFNDGHRYADYNPATDKMASYGVAALVAGGIAAKTGVFKGIWLAVLSLKKFAILAVAGAVAAIRAFLKKRSGGSPDSK
jgi:uncharacterized membrane-anchored protein